MKAEHSHARVSLIPSSPTKTRTESPGKSGRLWTTHPRPVSRSWTPGALQALGTTGMQGLAARAEAGANMLRLRQEQLRQEQTCRRPWSTEPSIELCTHKRRFYFCFGSTSRVFKAFVLKLPQQ
eukprot:1159085-Pelagomonas_calceolata.AAC.8